MQNENLLFFDKWKTNKHNTPWNYLTKSTRSLTQITTGVIVVQFSLLRCFVLIYRSVPLRFISTEIRVFGHSSIFIYTLSFSIEFDTIVISADKSNVQIQHSSHPHSTFLCVLCSPFSVHSLLLVLFCWHTRKRDSLVYIENENSTNFPLDWYDKYERESSWMIIFVENSLMRIPEFNFRCEFTAVNHITIDCTLLSYGNVHVNYTNRDIYFVVFSKCTLRTKQKQTQSP